MAIRLSQFMENQSTVDDNPKVMRLSDFMSMGRVPNQEPEGQFDAVGYFQITDEQRKEWEDMGPIGYFESAQRVDKTEMIPFFGGVESIVKSVKLKNAVDRIQADNYEFAPGKKAQDLDMVNKFLFKIAEEQVRTVTLGGKITTGASELPAFMVEFLATGGLASLGKAGIKQTVKHTAKNGLRGVVKSSVKKAAMRVAGATAGAVVRTTVGMPHRVIEQYQERQLNSQLALTEKGYTFLESAREKPFTSFMKAYGDVIIENLSEVAGPALTAGAKKIIPAKASKILTAAWKKLHPNEAVTKLFTKAGYNGFIEELGEERLGDLLRALTGVEDFGAGDGASVLDRVFASVPNSEEFMVEAGILMIPGAARATGSQAVQAYRNRVKQTSKDRRPGNIVINEETGEPLEIDATELTQKEIDAQVEFMFREREKQGRPTEPTGKIPNTAEGGKPNVKYISFNNDLEGYYDDKTQTIFISKDLPKSRQKEVLAHELTHFHQHQEGKLPISQYVSPFNNIKSFMDYVSDPQEVSARAAERGENIPKIWDEVFKLKNASLSGEYLEIPLEVEKVEKGSHEKIKPEGFKNMSAKEITSWNIRRLSKQLRIDDPKPIKVEEEVIRIHFKNNASGIEAEERLIEIGLDAFSRSPFSVDIKLTSDNLKRMREIGFQIIDQKNISNNPPPAKTAGVPRPHPHPSPAENIYRVIDRKLEEEVKTFEEKEGKRVSTLDKARIELKNIETTIKEVTATPEFNAAGVNIFEGKKDLLKSLQQDKKFFQEKIKGLQPIEKRQTESKALDEKIATFKRGARHGEVEQKKETKEVQDIIISMIEKSKLTDTDKKTFTRTIKNLQTIEQLEAQRPDIEARIAAREGKSFFRKTKDKIKAELKKIQPTKQAGKPVGKFTPEIQRILDKLAEISKLTKKEAQAQAISNVEMMGDRMPTAEEALNNRMLTLIGGLDESTDADFLNDLLDEIQTIKSTGRAGNLLRQFAQAERYDQMRKDAKNSIIGDKAPEKTTKEEKESRIKNAIKSFFIGQYGWNDKMDFLSQDDKSSKENDSRLSQMMRVDREIQNEKGGVRRNGERVVDMLARAFGFTGNRRKRERSMLRQLRRDSKIVNLGNFTNRRGEYIKFEISKAQARKLWMELQDPTLRESLTGEEQVAAGYSDIRGNAYSQEMIDVINTFLTSEDKALAKDQLKFYRDYWKTVNKAYKIRYGVDLPFNEFYSPIRRKNYNIDSGNEFLQDVGIRRSVASGSLKSRQPNLREIALQSDLEVLQRHIIEMEHFKAWAGKIQDINAVFNGKIRELIKRKYGSPIMKSIDFHIQNFTSGSVEKAKGFDKILEILRINFTQSVLAVKPALTVKQMVSFVAFADNIPTVDFFRGLAEFMTNPVKHSKILIEGSELLKNRGKDFTRDVKDAFNSQEFNAFRVTPSFKNLLMFTTRWGDKGAILLGGWSVYSYNRRQGKSHEEAIIEFERATASAQQSGDLDQLSDWQRGGPLAKMFTMFTSSQNQYFRKEVGAIRNLIKGRISPAKAAKKVLIYHFILPMFFQWVSDFGKWDEDEQLRAAVLGSFNGIFILEDMLDTIVRLGIKGAKDSDIGIYGFNSELEAFVFAKGIYKAVRHIDPNDILMEDIIEASKDLVEGTAGPLIGLPVKQVFNAAEGIADLGEGDTAEGALKLGGWSPYVVEKKIDKPGIF